MRALWILVALASTAHADVTTYDKDLQGWRETGGGTSRVSKGLELAGGAGVQRDAKLPETGWAVEVEVATVTTATSHGFAFAGDDGRQDVLVYVKHDAVVLDTLRVPLADPAKPHVIRLEVHGGRHRVLVDGKLAIDRDAVLDRYVDTRRPHVRLVALGETSARITRVTIDEAPANLARSKHAVLPVLPLGTTLHAFAKAAKIEAALAKLPLSADAAACTAFAIVGLGVKLPPKYVVADLRKLAPPQATRGCDPAQMCDCGMCSPDRAVMLLLANDHRSAVQTIGNALTFAAVESFPQIKLTPAKRTKLLATLKTLATSPRACF